MARLAPLFLLWLVSCSGPPAGDGAVCRDVIHRLCNQPRCAQVEAALGVTDNCEPITLDRTGCTTDDFGFSTPSRDHFLSCRIPLLRNGTWVEAIPDCNDVTDFLTGCPDVVNFLKGVPP